MNKTFFTGTLRKTVTLPAAFAIAVIFSPAYTYAGNTRPDGIKHTGTLFTNITDEAGLSDTSMQNGVWADINHDGREDLIITGQDGGLKTKVFLNTLKDGRIFFQDFTGESGLTKDTAFPGKERKMAFAVVSDVNNDGFIDIFSAVYCEYDKPATDKNGNIVRDEAGNKVYEKKDDGMRSEIYLNDGKGHFRQVPGNYFPPETISGAAFLDYDKDGIPDLYTGSWYKEYGISLLSYPGRLYKGKGDGTFTDVTGQAGMLTKETEGQPDSSRPVYGVSHGDWNSDGYEDIFVSVYGRQANRLWKNSGDGTFTDVGPQTGFDGDEIRHGRYPEWVSRNAEKEFRSHGNTFSAAPADYDNDGDLDIFTGEITHGWAGESSDRSSLLVNGGKKKNHAFKRYPDLLHRIHQSTVNWNQGDMRVSWADLDNDGKQELLVASGDYPDKQYLRVYHMRKPLEFEEVTDRYGIDWESSASISIADFNNDGCLDIIAGKSWMRMPKEKRNGRVPAPGLFLGKCDGHWMQITLRGKGAGATATAAPGTKAVLRTGSIFPHRQLRFVQTSHGHYGLSDSQRLHFGLGKSKKGTITVYWNTGAVTYKNLPADRFIRLTEGISQPEISPTPFAE